LNQVVHLWAYDSLVDRETRRAALAAGTPGGRLTSSFLGS
jgi:hypothetical protein